MLQIQQKTSEKLVETLNENYQVLSEYMDNSRLRLNGNKTHLMVMMTDQARRCNPDLKFHWK